MTNGLPLPIEEIAERMILVPHHRRSAGTARTELRCFLADVDGGELFREAGELLLTELIANAVRHARVQADSRIHIRLALISGVLRIEVHDADSRQPTVRSAGNEDEGGRGLCLVEQLSVEWGCDVRADASGKSVWCLVAPAGRGGGTDNCGDGPVVVEIEDITGPAAFDRLPDALPAIWDAVRLLPLGSSQYEAYKYFFTHSDAVARVREFIRREGELSLSLRMNSRLHQVRIRPYSSEASQ
ncbi:histidine kinase-like protein [Streptomyces sp. TLI_235]|nr:ATP-binding protein [Streptomyces sp. TLI_235]PBC66294.1 histidine kinase-like protein [Streptomyces sp. TLI_235]